MDPRTRVDRELEIIEDELNHGQITLTEHNDAVRDLERSYRDEAREAAQEAFDREMEQW